MSETQLIPYGDVERMGATIAKSGLFGVKTAEQAIALMLIAQAEGKHPATAAQEYHVIQGRASLKADQMLARFQNAGGSIKWLKRTDEIASAEFSHPQGGTLTITWTIERAKKAELSGKDNWKKFPAQMLSARVISEGVRAVFPAACGSFYTPEEVQDFEPVKPGKSYSAQIEEAHVVESPEATEAKQKAAAIVEELNAPKPVHLSADISESLKLKMLSQITNIGMVGTIDELKQFWADTEATRNQMSDAHKAELFNACKQAGVDLKAKANKAVIEQPTVEQPTVEQKPVKKGRAA